MKYNALIVSLIVILSLTLFGCTTGPTKSIQDDNDSASSGLSLPESLRINNLLRIGQYKEQYLPLSKSPTPPEHVLDRQGWGVTIGSGRILTAGHVINDPLQRYATQTRSNNPTIAPINNIWLFSGDLAIATTPLPEASTGSPRVRNVDPTIIGSSVYIIHASLHTGTITRIDTGTIELVTETPLLPGMSGSPVFTTSGELIAVITAISNQEKTVSYATHVRSILSGEVSPNTIE